MKTSITLLLAFLSLTFFHETGGAAVRHVPVQYATIQAAINAAAIGDTVLVDEGTYYENIRYRGKAIVLASLYLVDGDTAHIERTIINGSNPSSPDSGSVVYFVDGEDTSSVLCGFTVTGGKGTMWCDVPDGGFWLREGGGIFCESGGARIVSNFITRNRIEGTTADGAGLWVVNTNGLLPFLILEGNRITDNVGQADSLGVWVTAGGAVLYSASARITGNVFERNMAVAKDGASGAGLSFQGWPQGPYPVGLIQGNIFRDNVASTILRGAFGGGMVVEHTGPVTISDNLFEGNVAVSASNVGRGGGLWIGDAYLPGSLAPARKLIVRNSFLRNQAQGSGWVSGGGIELDATVATIAQNEISENTSTGTYYGGGGIWAYRSSCRVENNIIVRNHALGGGGVQFDSPPMPLRGTDQAIVNNTIVDNYATSGGGVSITGGAKVVLLNNILWADTAQNGKEIYISGGTANVQYCNIQGGWPSGIGNINTDPLFMVGDPMYNLQTKSPCIGRAIDSMQLGGVWYHVPSYDFDGHPRRMPLGPQPSDIGAQEEQLTVGIGSNATTLPSQFVLEQNYPNPFNPSARIQYTVGVAGGRGQVASVKLSVYDLLGREVEVLVNEKKAPGSYEVTFDAEGLSSGVYFYRLEAGSFVQIKKMVLLK